MNRIRQYVGELQGSLARLPLQAIDDVIQVLHEARLHGRQVFVIGNGGSASTASHIVCDLSKNTRVEGVPPLRTLDILDNSAVLTAYANDDGYENALALHIASFIQRGDILIAISTSGNSPNVLRAVEAGNAAGAMTIGFTGFDGGRLQSLASMNIHIDSSNIEQVEDIHLMLGHIITVDLRHLAMDLVLHRNGSQKPAAVSLTSSEAQTS
jgi:D-sedoheptulose 7-phosphate isomerase